MGLRGAGVQDHVYFWRALTFPEIFPEQEGLMVYTLIPNHFERLVRSWRYLNWAFPHYVVFKQRKEELVYEGVLADKFSFKWTNLMKRLGLNYWWLRLSSHHSDYQTNNAGSQMAQMILELKKAYLLQYPKGRFVVTWMRQPLMKEHRKYSFFKQDLARLGLEYWEPIQDDKLINEAVQTMKWEIPRDGHPTALANFLYSNFLIKRIVPIN